MGRARVCGPRIAARNAGFHRMCRRIADGGPRRPAPEARSPAFAACAARRGRRGSARLCQLFGGAAQCVAGQRRSMVPMRVADGTTFFSLESDLGPWGHARRFVCDAPDRMGPPQRADREAAHRRTEPSDIAAFRGVGRLANGGRAPWIACRLYRDHIFSVVVRSNVAIVRSTKVSTAITSFRVRCSGREENWPHCAGRYFRRKS